MATYRNRGEIVSRTDCIRLVSKFRDQNGNLSDLIRFPSISIIQPSGNVLLSPTSVGVYKIDTGVYGYDFITGINQSLGVYADIWVGSIDGYTKITNELNFVVYDSQMPSISIDGYSALGDDPGFDYSQEAIMNINRCLKLLKARLNSMGKKIAFDQYGNEYFAECDIYDIPTLVYFLEDSLSLFNSIPTFTNFSWNDTDIINQFKSIIVQGASLIALSSKALIEKGREFQVTDDGISFNPPSVADMLNSQFGTELSNHMERLKMVKANMRPAPISLGILSITSSRAPAITRLRHFRERRLI